jgi:hypothetical protein
MSQPWWCGDNWPEAFIFSSKRGTPIKYDSYLKRVLRPAAAACGIPEITHQLLWRGFSTAAVDAVPQPTTPGQSEPPGRERRLSYRLRPSFCKMGRRWGPPSTALWRARPADDFPGARTASSRCSATGGHGDPEEMLPKCSKSSKEMQRDVSPTFALRGFGGS